MGSFLLCGPPEGGHYARRGPDPLLRRQTPVGDAPGDRLGEHLITAVRIVTAVVFVHRRRVGVKRLRRVQKRFARRERFRLPFERRVSALDRHLERRAAVQRGDHRICPFERGV